MGMLAHVKKNRKQVLNNRGEACTDRKAHVETWHKYSSRFNEDLNLSFQDALQLSEPPPHTHTPRLILREASDPLYVRGRFLNLGEDRSAGFALLPGERAGLDFLAEPPPPPLTATRPFFLARVASLLLEALGLGEEVVVDSTLFFAVVVVEAAGAGAKARDVP